MRLAGIGAAAIAAGLMTGGDAHADRLTLEETESGHLAVEARINGSVPLRFLPDTAASHTAIAEPLAMKLGYDPGLERRDDVDALTQQIEADRHPVEIAVADLTRAVDAVVIDVAPDTTLSAFGLLGTDFFDGLTVEYDLEELTLDLDAGPPERIDGRIPPERRVLVAETRMPGVRDPVQVLIDTGSPTTLVNPTLAERAYGVDRPITVTINGVQGRTDDSRRAVPLTDIEVGGWCARRAWALESDLYIFNAMGWSGRPALILGLDQLAGSRIVVDYEEGVFQIDGPEDQSCGRRHG
ncbi:hypothetical protein DDZ18_08380 [Marinicauda salina]|uniref:Peptidase A2 domain-containing protein n=1 Tax=Marinicauda salina TaxID=2135793 RepID=A0A2U2BUF8_9PROT|nr:aspartyl protease family protein [Marinicauda salina]PWE17665.1 hypothetical protein DDZ18_08380 [Marinicauda salina]